MSAFGSGVHARELTDLIGIGVTLNADGSIATITGPTWRRSTVDPNGVVTALAGSMVSQTNGTFWINQNGGTVWASAGGAGGASYADSVAVTWGTTSPQQGSIRLNPAGPNAFTVATPNISQATALLGAQIIITTGTNTITGAVVGSGSNAISIGTGATDVTNAGGTGGPSGALNFATGAALATAGASGSTGNINFVTGASTSANSGNLVFTTGTAAGTRGVADFNVPTLDFSTQATAFTLAAASATALVIGGAAPLLTFDTVASQVNATARLTTTDAVTAGTARVIGGLAFSTTADSATITGNGAAQSFNQSYGIPANTLKAGSTVRIRGCVRRIAINGADTALVTVRLGATIYVTGIATIALAGERCYFEAILTARAAPGAAVAVVGAGVIGWNTAATPATTSGGTANLATNGVLTVDVQITMANNVGNTAALEQLFVDVV